MSDFEKINSVVNSSNLTDRAKIGFEMFKIHADQRVRFIQFFSAFYVGTFAAGTFFISVDKNVGAVAFVALLGISSLFWALERRTRELVKKSESVMMLDPDYRFIIEKFDDKQNPSYSKIFDILYILSIVIALCGAAVLYVAS